MRSVVARQDIELQVSEQGVSLFEREEIRRK
jgi:hypothetical protein